MIHRDARALARPITATAGHACTVPPGHGPDGYCARIWSSRGADGLTDWHGSHPERPVDFCSRAEWEAWRAFTQEADRRQTMERLRRRQPRSLLDMLIDWAVWLEEAP